MCDVTTGSVAHLLDETDTSLIPAPLFTARLELCEPDLVFKPSLDRDMADNLYDICIALLEAGLISIIFGGWGPFKFFS